MLILELQCSDSSCGDEELCIDTCLVDLDCHIGVYIGLGHHVECLLGCTVVNSQSALRIHVALEQLVLDMELGVVGDRAIDDALLTSEYVLEAGEVEVQRVSSELHWRLVRYHVIGNVYVQLIVRGEEEAVY